MRNVIEKEQVFLVFCGYLKHMFKTLPTLLKRHSKIICRFDKPLFQTPVEPEKIWHYEIHAPWPNDAAQNQDGTQSTSQPDGPLPMPPVSEHFGAHQLNQIPIPDSVYAAPPLHMGPSATLPPNQTFAQLSNFGPNLDVMSPGDAAQFYQNPAEHHHDESSMSNLITVPKDGEMPIDSYHHSQAAPYHMSPSANHMPSEHQSNFAPPGGHYIPQYHSMQIQPPPQTYDMYHRPQQMLPKIEELMGPPSVRPHQDYANSTPPQMMYPHATPHRNEYYHHHGVGPPPHYEPISKSSRFFISRVNILGGGGLGRPDEDAERTKSISSEQQKSCKLFRSSNDRHQHANIH